VSASISVIIPCYRCSETIERAVDSIAQQTLLPSEVFLIEDASNDNGKTLQFLYLLQKKFQDKFKIEVIPLATNSGPGTARNAGWDKATSRYIAFLDADDAWHPQKLEMQFNWMEAHPEVSLTGHLTKIFDQRDLLLNFLNQIEELEINRKQLLISNRFPTRSVMLRRGLSQRFEPGKRQAEDFLLWLNIVLNGHKAVRLEVALAYSFKADFGEGGLTGQLWKMEKGELDTYQRILRNKLINRLEFFGIVGLSLFKFLRRVLVAQIQIKKFL
jgi:glycosyltransferase involved in cell wall biosynthesis